MNRWILACELGVWLGRLIAGLMCCAVAFAADPPRTLVPCKVTEIHDADTFWCDALLPWDITIRHQSVRVQGADAWEITRARRTVTITDAELKKGRIAKDAVTALFGSAKAIYLEPPRAGDVPDPHSRMSAWVWVWDGEKLIDFAQWLKDNGHTRK